MSVDVAKLIKGIHEYLGKELKPLFDRIKALESRQPEKGEQGEKGDTGQDGKPGLDGKNGKDGEPGLQGEKGDAGRDGKDGAPGLQGKDGSPGLPGEIGPRGEKGERGDPPLVSDVEKMVDNIVTTWAVGFEQKAQSAIDSIQKAMGKIHQPKDGIDGKDGAKGADGIPGPQGEKGEKGERGQDGKSISSSDIEKMLDGVVSKWALDFERRAQDTIQKAMERIQQPRDGVDGQPGVDGLGFKDLQVEQIGVKTVQLKFVNDDQERKFNLTFPVVVDAGVYKQGKDYLSGDGVTYGGSFWIAQKDNPNQKPGTGSEWRLAVKRGKDGNI